MRKIGIGFFMLIMITSSIVSAQDSQTVSFKGDGDAWVLLSDCSGIPDTSALDPYLGVQSVVGSVATLPCNENPGTDCPNGYKIIANIQIDKGCGPQFSTNGPTPILDPALEFVDCNAAEVDGFAILASFIVLGPEGDPIRLIEIGRHQYSGTDQEDSGFVRVKLRLSGEWICHRTYGIDYEGRKITCK